MERIARVVCVFTAVVAVSVAGAGAAVMEENFDSYPTGSQIVDQANWLLWADDATDASNAGALVSSAFSKSTRNSLQVSGVDSVPGLNSDVTWQFGPITSGVVTITGQVYIPGNAVLGEQAITFLARHPGDGTYSGPDGIDWISNGYSFKLDTGTVNTPGGTEIPFVRDEWKEIKIVADVDNLTYDTFYDGTPLTVGGTWDGPNQFEAIDFWANNGGNGCSPIFYDDLRMSDGTDDPGTDIPEPATMALLGLAACGLGGYVRRRRKA